MHNSPGRLTNHFCLTPLSLYEGCVFCTLALISQIYKALKVSLSGSPYGGYGVARKEFDNQMNNSMNIRVLADMRMAAMRDYNWRISPYINNEVNAVILLIAGKRSRVTKAHETSCAIAPCEKSL